MNSEDPFDRLIKDAQDELTDPARNKIVRGIEGEAPRFELLHNALSICSQKVRTVLAEKGAAYMSREMITPSMAGIGGLDAMADNYRPGFVRLRIHAAGLERMGRLNEGHTLRTSAELEGFDACVVPLLIDHQKRRAVVDSVAICAYIDAQLADTNPLVPADIAEDVMAQVRRVDEIPNPGQLYAFHEDDPRPEFLKKAMDGIYDRKCAMLRQMIDENSDDAELVRAYEAKFQREASGGKVQRDPVFLGGIKSEFAEIITALNAKLEASDGPWIFGGDFTLADAVWGVNLFRIHWLGHAYLWDHMPRVRDYAYRTYRRPSIWESAITWPAPTPPSPHTEDVLAMGPISS
ncbi:MAG: glutathione S-transferase family protein [Rhodospirillaceae bacterium]|jgi:glutathione S-transferase|nr:glutathione S-transferase family protein [Rhodospirillaceae bacterium]MBT4115364.1 glutathione S-transferase family protein [Rhodospirillaceae bacterium]MBT4671760.1 glutathione S-transferase family protein [Rhodospirillaceae bacterium]MBT4720143.1 glutathione S-transferase family protein [Rhodospirillaceae bacterium]MBT5178574.1 glutathione S-transferase family protein [Rhodospirillaceae bacterium]